MQHGNGTEGMQALLASLAISGAAIGLVLITAALLAHWYPQARLFFHPLNLLVLIGQVVDGATTWIGVVNPFGLNIPPYRETVFVSGVIIEVFGGFVYFVLKVVLGIMVVLALGAAIDLARNRKEQMLTLLVQVSLIVIGAIPVWNNVSNFLAAT